ncbi:hypothetical protein GCM10025794_32790 [Massilia kyonggiensis]|jgi:hypothetical protein
MLHSGKAKQTVCLHGENEAWNYGEETVLPSKLGLLGQMI